jgi:hypothetical protein
MRRVVPLVPATLRPGAPNADSMLPMRTSVLLLTSLALVAPHRLRAEPVPPATLAIPTVAGEQGPGIDIDLRLRVFSGPDWFAGWVACSGAQSGSSCATFDPVQTGALVAELALPKLWDVIANLPFGGAEQSVSLFVAAAHGGASAPGGVFADDPAPPIMTVEHTSPPPVIDDHPTVGDHPLDTGDHGTPVTSTPEPATLVLAASGFAALVGFARRRRARGRE